MVRFSQLFTPWPNVLRFKHHGLPRERLPYELELWGGPVEKFIGDAVMAPFGKARRCSLLRRREKRISEIFLTRLRVAATLVCLSSSASRLANGGKEVTLHYRFTIDSNWPLGTRVDICA
jgi:class 3 adenylate cyclase